MPKPPASKKARMINEACKFIHHGDLQGICLESIDGEELTLRLPYRNELVGNPDTGTIHSGALTVLLDQAIGIAGICHKSLGSAMAPTLDLRIDHLGTAPPGKDIFAVARIYKVTRRVLFGEGFAYCESRDKPIARVTGSWVQMPELELDRILPQDQAEAQQQ